MVQNTPVQTDGVVERVAYVPLKKSVHLAAGKSTCLVSV